METTRRNQRDQTFHQLRRGENQRHAPLGLVALAPTGLVTAWLGSAGIPVPHVGSAQPAVLRPALSLATVGWGSGLALAASALTGAVVAWRVTRLKPVEASRG